MDKELQGILQSIRETIGRLSFNACGRLHKLKHTDEFRRSHKYMDKITCNLRNIAVE